MTQREQDKKGEDNKWDGTKKEKKGYEIPEEGRGKKDASESAEKLLKTHLCQLRIIYMYTWYDLINIIQQSSKKTYPGAFTVLLWPGRFLKLCFEPFALLPGQYKKARKKAHCMVARVCDTGYIRTRRNARYSLQVCLPIEQVLVVAHLWWVA